MDDFAFACSRSVSSDNGVPFKRDFNDCDIEWFRRVLTITLKEAHVLKYWVATTKDENGEMGWRRDVFAGLITMAGSMLFDVGQPMSRLWQVSPLWNADMKD